MDTALLHGRRRFMQSVAGLFAVAAVAGPSKLITEIPEPVVRARVFDMGRGRVRPMTVLCAQDIEDLVAQTLIELGPLRWQQIASYVQKYEEFSKGLHQKIVFAT